MSSFVLYEISVYPIRKSMDAPNALYVKLKKASYQIAPSKLFGVENPYMLGT